MSDWPLVVVRFVLYGGLGLLFGLPFFTLTSGREAVLWSLFRLARVVAVLALVGLVASPLGFALIAAQMSGTSPDHLDPSVAATLFTQTALGWALIARLAALILALAIALLVPAKPVKTTALTVCGGVAVATLAWSGHGAADVGARGIVHLGGDIVHLLMASAWIGALALLLATVLPRRSVSRERLSIAHDALAGFSRMGTVLVALLIVTGLLNGAFTIGPNGIAALPYSTYGRLLIAKLLLFAGMLVCAALNRFQLTPRLHASLGRGELRPSLTALRRSIAAETALALLAFGLVAWFGMLEPPSA